MRTCGSYQISYASDSIVRWARRGLLKDELALEGGAPAALGKGGRSKRHRVVGEDMCDGPMSGRDRFDPGEPCHSEPTKKLEVCAIFNRNRNS